MFKAAKRLASKGSESKVISIERLYQILHHAANEAFPNVGQDCSERKVIASGYEFSGFAVIVRALRPEPWVSVLNA